MNSFWWLLAVVAAVAAMWWAGLKGLALLVSVVCGLAALAYLVVRTQRPSVRPERSEEDTRDVQRDIPPGPAP